MNKGNDKGKVISFPGTDKRMVEEGLEKLKSGEPGKSAHYFKEALRHDPDYEQAKYGLLLSYAELGHLQKGVELARSMMQKGEGEYFEVLQVYLSLLAQLGEYELVVTTLEAVQAETKLPSHLAEPLFELLNLSRKMMESDAAVEEENVENVEDVEAIEAQLEHFEKASFDQQWQALTELKRYKSKATTRALESLLTKESVFPVIKSFIILLLKDWDVDHLVKIHKNGKKDAFIPNELPSFEEQPPAPDILGTLFEKLESKDPTLLENARHLLYQLLLYEYPFSLPAYDIGTWCSAIHLEAVEQMGQEVVQEEIIRDYQANEKSPYGCREYIQNTLQASLSSR